MSKFSSWAYTSKATVWRPTLNEYGEPVSWVRTVHRCSYNNSGELVRDSAGSEFIPAFRFWLEAYDDEAPRIGDNIKLGVHYGLEPPTDAEKVRMVRTHDSSVFNEGPPDREVMT